MLLILHLENAMQCVSQPFVLIRNKNIPLRKAQNRILQSTVFLHARFLIRKNMKESDENSNLKYQAVA